MLVTLRCVCLEGTSSWTTCQGLVKHEHWFGETPCLRSCGLEDVNFSSSVLLRLFLSSISVRLAAETASSAYYIWDRWRLLVLSIQKSATSDLLWFRNHVFDLGLFDVNVGGVGDSLRRGFSSWCDLSHYWWLSATAAEESKLKHQPQREPAWTMILELAGA